MSRAVVLVIVILCAVVSVSAQATQAEQNLKQYFEGKNVTLKTDMPATKDGVNIYPERVQPLNYGEYANRLKQHGTSLRRGDEIMITKVKVKDKHIEFQLGGGGYGTIGDDTDSDVHAQNAGKSRREKRVEEELKGENDPSRRRRLRDELVDLRREREREDRYNRAIAAEASEERRARIEQKALQGGSRFNIHFSAIDSQILTPEVVMEALKKYVDFSNVDDADENVSNNVSNFEPASYSYPADEFMPGVVQVGPRTTYLKEGLTTQEVVRLLGKPSSIVERSEIGVLLTVYVFPRGENRVLIAEVVKGALVRSTIETRGEVAQADR
jgi:outer membrane protein assembly factor BamE (lipoprotein component of BamABCDE complex)